MKSLRGLLIIFLVLCYVANAQQRPGRRDNKPQRGSQQGRDRPRTREEMMRRDQERQRRRKSGQEEQQEQSQSDYERNDLREPRKTDNAQQIAGYSSKQNNYNRDQFGSPRTNQDDMQRQREQKQKLKAEERKFKHLVRLLTVIVIGLIIIIVLCILKPIFMRRNRLSEEAAPMAAPTVEEVISRPSVSNFERGTQVKVQQAIKIEIIKDRFLNKSDSVDNVAQTPSETKIETEILRLTPTFGEYTFRNNK